MVRLFLSLVVWEESPDICLGTAFDWASLSEGSVVVDVGGGIGTASIPLARDFPHLNVVIQDLPSVIEDAKKVIVFILRSLPHLMFPRHAALGQDYAGCRQIGKSQT